MRVTLHLSEKEKLRLIEYMIHEISDQIKKRLLASQSKLNSLVKTHIKEKFFASSAYESLINGQLKEDLGLDSQAANNLKVIIEKVLDNSQVGEIETTTYGKRIEIFYKWGFLKTGYSDITTLKEASYISNQMPEWSGKKIPWLEWLLIGCPGVQGYYVARVSEATAAKYGSRSGRALMFRAKGYTWNLEVDSNKVGGLNERDNFLTKIFDDIGQVIFNYVKAELE